MKTNSILKNVLLLFILQTSTQLIGQSLFWEISGNGLKKPSYLFGTMHTTNSEVYNLSPEVFAALENADLFAAEVNFDSLNPMEIMEKVKMKNDVSLNSLLSKEEYEEVNTFFKDSLSSPLFVFKRLQPMFLVTLITEKKLKGKADKAPLDMWLAEKAAEHNTRITGLETFDEQFEAFESITYEQQAEILYRSVHDYDEENEVEKMLDAYLKSDIDKLYELSLTIEGVPEDFEKVFLTDRNLKMFKRSDKVILNGESMFIAVGAAHLGGDKGLIELYRQAGYEVNPGNDRESN